MYTDVEVIALEFAAVLFTIESSNPEMTMLGDTTALLVEDDEAAELVEEDSPMEPEPDDTGFDSAGAGVGLDDSLEDCVVVLVVFDEADDVLLPVCVEFEEVVSFWLEEFVDVEFWVWLVVAVLLEEVEFDCVELVP